MPIPFSNASFPNFSPNPMNSVIGRGSLVSFNYSFHKPGHDAYPLVLVTDVNYQYKGNFYLRGINLHYLTFPIIKKLIFPAPGQTVAENTNFTYQYIRGDQFVKASFRQYKKGGIQFLKKMNTQLIVNALSISRSFDPNEIEAIRKSVRNQINQIMNPNAANANDFLNK